MAVTAHPVGWIFSPQDLSLGLGVEAYSPHFFRKIVRQGSKAASFEDAADDLHELAGIDISARHVERLTERVGMEWQAIRDREVSAFQRNELHRMYAEAPQACAVMLDGGRIQIREEELANKENVKEKQETQSNKKAEDDQGDEKTSRWREPKYASILSLPLKSTAEDPHPQPPAKFLDRNKVPKLVHEVKSRTVEAKSRAKAGQETKDVSSDEKPSPPKKPSGSQGPKYLVRTAVATMEEVQGFGWQVATEVYRRSLDRATVKGCVCDGQKSNWTVWKEHLEPLGFIPILDFLHLLGYLFLAAQATQGVHPGTAWELYVKWMEYAWTGKVGLLIEALRGASAQLGLPPPKASENDPRRIVLDALNYVENNQTRMDYPRYRKLGLPTSSAPVESLIKQFNRRVKGTEKAWCWEGAEAILQVRAAHLSQDGRVQKLWATPRPHRRAQPSRQPGGKAA